ncbi:MAG: hypothetical protein WC197_00085 [Candidatus Gastranaerophilaceae bacterium]|jgi:type II secretory pathway component PulC
MKNNKYLIAIIFVLFLFVLSFVEYKYVGWQEEINSQKLPAPINQGEDADKTDLSAIEKKEENNPEKVENQGIVDVAQKKLVAESFNSCGESTPFIIPGYIKTINDSSIVVVINQKGYNEDKEILINEFTSIIELEMKKNEKVSGQRVTKKDNLKEGMDIIAKVVVDIDNNFIADQIKYLIFN